MTNKLKGPHIAQDGYKSRETKGYAPQSPNPQSGHQPTTGSGAPSGPPPNQGSSGAPPPPKQTKK